MWQKGRWAALGSLYSQRCNLKQASLLCWAPTSSFVNSVLGHLLLICCRGWLILRLQRKDLGSPKIGFKARKQWRVPREKVVEEGRAVLSDDDSVPPGGCDVGSAGRPPSFECLLLHMWPLCTSILSSENRRHNNLCYSTCPLGIRWIIIGLKSKPGFWHMGKRSVTLPLITVRTTVSFSRMRKWHISET